MAVRLNPVQRKRIITNAAVRVALREGLVNVSNETVADECLTETSVATVRKYFSTVSELQVSVIEEHSTSDELQRQAKELGLI